MMRFRGISQVTVTEWICGPVLRRRHARVAVRFVIENATHGGRQWQVLRRGAAISMPGGIKPVAEKGHGDSGLAPDARWSFLWVIALGSNGGNSVSKHGAVERVLRVCRIAPPWLTCSMGREARGRVQRSRLNAVFDRIAPVREADFVSGSTELIRLECAEP